MLEPKVCFQVCRLGRGRTHDVATLIASRISLASKIALLDHCRPKVFQLAEAQGHKFGMKNVRLKMAHERLPHGGDAGSKLFAKGDIVVAFGRRIAIVEHNVSPPWQTGNETKRRKDGLLCEIWHNAQPCEKALFCWIETNRGQTHR